MIVAASVAFAVFIIAALIFIFRTKQDISKERNELSEVRHEIEVGKTLIKTNEEIRLQKQAEIDRLSEDLVARHQSYAQVIQDLNKKVDECYQENLQKQDARLQHDADVRKSLLNMEVEKATKEHDAKLAKLAQELLDSRDSVKAAIEEINDSVARKQDFYNSLIEPLKIIEKESNEKYYYAIEMNETDIADIKYLLENVSPQLNNKDIIPKLVWTTYVQKPLQATLKKLEIEDAPGIYKLTNIKNNKCYIGKSTKVRQRIIDHYKSACGISSISDQFIHHVMLNEGLNQWMIECLCVCEKDELGAKEKEYIAFFDSTNYGYNVASGG